MQELLDTLGMPVQRIRPRAPGMIRFRCLQTCSCASAHTLRLSVMALYLAQKCSELLIKVLSEWTARLPLATCQHLVQPWSGGPAFLTADVVRRFL